MFKKQLIFIIILLTTLVIVSGCQKKAINNQITVSGQVKNQGQYNQNQQWQNKEEIEAIKNKIKNARNEAMKIDKTNWQNHEYTKFKIRLAIPNSWDIMEKKQTYLGKEENLLLISNKKAVIFIKISDSIPTIENITKLNGIVLDNIVIDNTNTNFAYSVVELERRNYLFYLNNNLLISYRGIDNMDKNINDWDLVTIQGIINTIELLK